MNANTERKMREVQRAGVAKVRRGDVTFRRPGRPWVRAMWERRSA